MTRSFYNIRPTGNSRGSITIRFAASFSAAGHRVLPARREHDPLLYTPTRCSGSARRRFIWLRGLSLSRFPSGGTPAHDARREGCSTERPDARASLPCRIACPTIRRSRTISPSSEDAQTYVRRSGKHLLLLTVITSSRHAPMPGAQIAPAFSRMYARQGENPRKAQGSLLGTERSCRITSCGVLEHFVCRRCLERHELRELYRDATRATAGKAHPSQKRAAPYVADASTRRKASSSRHRTT